MEYKPFGFTEKTAGGGGIKNIKGLKAERVNKTALFSRLLRQARDTEDLF